MIKKFIKISGTGKFLNYNHSSDLVPSLNRANDFGKFNLLYGENGSGKTTLSIILRSLKNNNELLLKKRAFDRNYPQKVEILTDSSPTPKFVFSDNTWNNHYSNLEIFDVHFINDNIYTGLEIENANKKNLFEIIFGEQGLVLKSDILHLKDDIQTAQTRIRLLTENIKIAIGDTFSATKFCNLPVDPDVDKKILAKETEIRTVKSFQEIQNKSALVTLQLLQMPYETDNLIVVLNKSIENISEKYLDKFREHKNHLSMNGKSEEWIKQGFENIKENTCPFCLRPFDQSIDIIEAYHQYFNEEYNLLLNALQDFNLSISKYNIESQLLQIEAKISSNNSLIEYWNGYITPIPIINSIINYQTNIQNAFTAVKTIFKEKLQNPIQSKDTTSVIDFQRIVNGFNLQITSLNDEIVAYNLRIASLKSASQPNIFHLEADFKELIAIKKRSDTSIIALCAELTTKTEKIKALKIDKELKQNQLDSYSLSIFTDYASKINGYLTAFAPYLKIQNIEGAYVGSSKEPMVKYALTINGNEVNLENIPSQPSFKYCLSEGDKNALALAFFFTKLELDQNIQNKIIVFDDPVSSFDINRKTTTISKMIHIGQFAKQLFVFTHNIIFAGEFWKAVNVNSQTQCCKIELIGNTSCIVNFNIDNETLTSVLKDCLAIKNYLDSGCLSDQERRGIARCLRPVLESYFHLKFFDLLSSDEWLGNFISKVRNASKSSDKFYRLKSSLDELEDINNYSKKYHHRFNTNNESEPVTDAELRGYCQRTLDLIQLI